MALMKTAFNHSRPDALFFAPKLAEFDTFWAEITAFGDAVGVPASAGLQNLPPDFGAPPKPKALVHSCVKLLSEQHL